MRPLIFVLAASLALAMGCSGKSAEDTQEAAVQEQAMPAPTEQAVPAPDEQAPVTIDAEVASATLTGTLGCGHCNYNIGESCSAAVKTAEGQIVILDGVGNGHELFDRRQELRQVALAGTLSEDGTTFTVASYEIQ